MNARLWRENEVLALGKSVEKVYKMKHKCVIWNRRIEGYNRTKGISDSVKLTESSLHIDS